MCSSLTLTLMTLLFTLFTLYPSCIAAAINSNQCAKHKTCSATLAYSGLG